MYNIGYYKKGTLYTVNTIHSRILYILNKIGFCKTLSDAGKFLELGEYDKQFYGTSLDRSILRQNDNVMI